MTNQVAQQQRKVSVVAAFFKSPNVQKKITELVDKNAASFTTSVLQIVNSNALLRNAEPKSILNAACMAATLNLPLQNGLGFAYIVPFKNSQTKTTEAQFQIGYKGFIQLAQRSGQFKRLVAVPVYKNQLIKKDFINGFEFDWEQEPAKDETPIGYYAYFRLVNDFSAELYMSYSEIQQHASKYSKSYDNKFGVWKNNFDSMALKTVIKLLLSKQAPLSIEMQKAVLSDQSVIQDDGSFEYIDNSQQGNIYDANFSHIVDDETFNKLKENITNKEVTIQELCDNGYEFSAAQYAELEELENAS